jgi:hypothetical protein
VASPPAGFKDFNDLVDPNKDGGGPGRLMIATMIVSAAPEWTPKRMSGRRPFVKGLVEALRTYRVRSCLRPVGAGNECPAGPDAGPHGSSPNQQNALVMAPAFRRASEPFRWFTSLRRRPRCGSPCGETSFLLSLLIQAATGRSS